MDNRYDELERKIKSYVAENVVMKQLTDEELKEKIDNITQQFCNDIYLPIGDNKYKYIDTIIFGNKFVYITKEINQAGEVRVSLQDNKWRVIYNGSLALIDNPFLYNEKVINYLVNIVDGLEQKDLKNLVVLSKTCTISKTEEYENEIIATENDAINKIFDDYLNVDSDNWRKVWTIYTFLVWYEEYFVKR